MRIPTSLRIGGHTFKVRLAEMETGCGEMDREKGLISIRKDLMDTQRESTLFHEIFHVLNSELDHVILDGLAEQLYQVLKDNRMLR